MKAYKTIKPENVFKEIRNNGYFCIVAKDYYDEEYTGPTYIIATEDESFREKYPEYEDMVIMSIEKFLKLADALNKSILNDEREMKRWERHHNKEGYYEEVDETDSTGRYLLAIKDMPSNPVADETETNIKKESLHKAISKLKEKPRRRLIAYYFKGLTFRQIGDLEGVSDMAVRDSINGAIKKLKKYL